jgi:hypothetical protein
MVITGQLRLALTGRPAHTDQPDTVKENAA